MGARAAPAEGMRMAELLASLSFAIDLGVGMPMEWVLRACLMSMRLGEAAGLDLPRRRNLYYLALLRHVGCTSTAAAAVRDFGDDHGLEAGFALDLDDPAEGLRFLFTVVAKDKPLPKRAAILARLLAGGERIKRENRAAHCEVAERLAERLAIDPGLPPLFRQIYARWDGKGAPKGMKGNAIALEVRVLHIAYDAATLFAAGGKRAVTDAVGRRSGGLFDPDLAALFLKDAEALLAPLAETSAWDAVLAAEPGAKARIPPERLDEALQALADFTDFKSPFTLGHSRAVSELAGEAARLAGLDADEAADVRRAAWLQDIGRVGVAGSIWAKPGPLNEGEWERVRLHPYFTERILARAPSLARWAGFAALHHERLDGSGYHRRAPAGQLPMAARLLAAADAYRAMREERPHRAALSETDAAAELRREAKQGRLDGAAAEAVLRAAGHAPASRPASAGLGLSGREIEVLRLAARGLSNRQMGQVLCISAKTVDHHLQHIYAKIGVSTRAGAALYAVEKGLLDLAPATLAR
jgi:HD-GYP domain-containing protein (c-di-GMP phosphodiesterase class II)